MDGLYDARLHELLSKYEGNFQMEIDMDGLSEPVMMNSTHKMILGGRFLELRQKGAMIGMDYESVFTIGFNTIDQTFSMTTITNMGTGTPALQGKWNVDKSYFQTEDKCQTNHSFY